jgi:DNA-binding response OmpR family regulator
MDSHSTKAANTQESILVVEDEAYVRECICAILRRAGYRVLTAHDGLKALEVLASQPIDLILADITMPEMNGYQLYESVAANAAWVHIPFIFLTARAMDSDVRYGKALGVDDYVTKPFHNNDLLASVQGRLRRARQRSAAMPSHVVSTGRQPPHVLTYGELDIDLEKHRVWTTGETVSLSVREFRLLACLVENRGRVVPHQELVRATHNLDTDKTEAGSLLRPLIRSLRRKLGYRTGQMGCIRNLRGVGYEFVAPTS